LPDRGYIRFYRSIFRHPVFRQEPLTEREAWAWLIAEAAWKPRQHRLGEHLVNLDRGEVVGAVRYLATEWQWSTGKVVRFLERLKNEYMIGTRTGTGITVISISNYSTYQGETDDLGTAVERQPERGRNGGGTAAERERNGVEYNRKELNHSSIEELEEGKAITADRTLFGNEALPTTKPAGPNYEAMFRQWYAIYPKKVDPKDALKSFQRVLKSGGATFEELTAGAERYAREVAAAGTEKRFIKAPAVWLNKGSWMNEPAGQSRYPARSGFVGSAIQGIASRITERDFDDGGG
jgi:hypothetical protein